MGPPGVERERHPLLAGEDFAFILERVPGAYLLFSRHGHERGGMPVHNPAYYFNDDLLPISARYLLEVSLKSC